MEFFKHRKISMIIAKEDMNAKNFFNYFLVWIPLVTSKDVMAYPAVKVP